MRPGTAPASAMSRQRSHTSELTVVLLDDDAAARGELRAALARQLGIRVIGEAARGSELFALLEQAQPDVVALDVLLRRDDGVDLIRRLRRRYPALKVVVLSNQVNESVLLPALRAGAHGYLDRMEGPAHIADALHLVCRDERVVPGQRAVTQVVRELQRLAQADVQMRIGLTAAERNLLALVAEGLSNQDIAARIGCSLATVKRHLTQLFSKLQAPDRNSAISEALRQGML
jgi:DNA-binding NarL/FixJ family response regulator